jgi:hypothetical protein
MPLSRETMQLFIIICLVGIALLAVLFLRTRRMTLTSYITWGLLALLLPLLGPFLVILSRPGERIHRLRKRKPRRRGSWVLL